MTKREIAEGLNSVIHCISQDHLQDVTPIAAELIEKLTKRLKK